MNFMTEQWRAVNGFPAYEVSDVGRIRRSVVARNGRKCGLLVPRLDRLGYLRIGLRANGKKSMCLVHRLVAIAFIPNPLHLSAVNHKNGINTDVFVTNLEWRSNRGNELHAMQNNLKMGEGVHFNQKHSVYKAGYAPKPNTWKHLGSFSTYDEALAARQAAIATLQTVL